MSACEKCWTDAGGSSDAYRKLLAERLCTPEEQAGPNAERCPVCLRKTLHQHTGQPMCGCPYCERPQPVKPDAGERLEPVTEPPPGV